jgi:SAM-dependent methyltransferase
MRDDRTHWEKRHQASEEPGPPSSFLIANAAFVKGRVLDIACGRGGNTLYLARRGNVVEAIDIALPALHCARRVAIAEELPLHLVQADLDDFPLPTERYDAVINFRFLKREIFPSLARALKPGGVLLFETFLIDQQQIGHPKNPDFLLRHGELRNAFRSLEELQYEEGLFDAPDGKAFVARLLARRRL